MGPKILTVDDTKAIRKTVCRAFKGFACEIIEAGDGVEGLATAKRVRPEIILLDVRMPMMDGMEMLAKLKADPELRAIPVIMLTGESDRESVLRIAKLGVRDYLVKPFKVEGIVERVCRIIDLKATGELAARTRRFDDPLQILVVDDKPAILEQVRVALGSTRWGVHGVAQAGQAVDFCNQSVPDLALVSLSLPDNSGFTLLQMFKASARTSSIPMLALSVKTATEEQARAQQLGFKSIITKPIDADDLQLKITRSLNLDTSSRFLQQRDGVFMLLVPATINPSVAREITAHLRTKINEAVNAGLNRLVVDLSQLKSADMTLVKFLLEVIQLCGELAIRHCLIGSEAVRGECKNYEETKGWQFTGSFTEAQALFDEKTPAMA